MKTRKGGCTEKRESEREHVRLLNSAAVNEILSPARRLSCSCWILPPSPGSGSFSPTPPSFICLTFPLCSLRFIVTLSLALIGSNYVRAKHCPLPRPQLTMINANHQEAEVANVTLRNQTQLVPALSSSSYNLCDCSFPTATECRCRSVVMPTQLTP